MKNICSLCLLLSVLTAGLLSCEKSKDFIADESVNTKVYLPVSTNALVDMADNLAINSRVYAAGASFKTELQLFSIDPIKEINLYETVGTGTRTKVGSPISFAPAYSNLKRIDTLLVPYTVGAGLASGVSIKLDYEILNVNTKSLIRTATIKVK